ncbi:MAG: hypothetical protein ABS93_03520 [Thiobacillus sp. SCN 62-729]|nr:MAG: hypothetical protein ABS93_03520 [Thiobacillus sp. SCN 62-729]
MAVHLHMVSFGKRDQGIRLREIEASTLGLDDGEFHRVLRRDEVELARQQFGIGGVRAQGLDVHGGAEADPGRVRQAAHAVGGKGEGGRGARDGGRDRHEGDAPGHVSSRARRRPRPIA